MTDYIQIGSTALRDPKTGALMDSVPIYVRAADREKVPQIDCSAVIKTLAEQYGQYVRRRQDVHR